MTRFKPSDYQRLPSDEDLVDKIEMERLSPEQRQEIGTDLEQMYGRLQDLGPQFAPIIDEMNDIAREYNASEDPGQRDRLEMLFADKKTELDAKLDKLDKLREKKNTILKLLGVGIATAGIGGLLAGIFKAISNALGSGEGGGTGGGGGGGIPSDDNIVKKVLKKLASILKDLASKALDALPGIIGSIVSTLLKSGAAVVSYFADHLWAFGAAMGLIIYQTFITNVKK